MPEEDSSDSENDNGYSRMKKTIDNQLKPIVQRLKSKYPSGLCHTHPTIHCFYYAPKDWHFELDQNRLNVWAHAIVCCLTLFF